jgi:hypothetical protein
MAIVTNIELEKIEMFAEDKFGLQGKCLVDGVEKYCAMQFKPEDKDKTINELFVEFKEHMTDVIEDMRI